MPCRFAAARTLPRGFAASGRIHNLRLPTRSTRHHEWPPATTFLSH